MISLRHRAALAAALLLGAARVVSAADAPPFSAYVGPSPGLTNRPAAAGTNRAPALLPAAAARRDTNTPPEATAPLVYAGTNAKTKSAWQQHLTLGAGDVVNLTFYGRGELARADVTIEPDGRISYLQAQGVMASGLTIDELRQALNDELGKYYRHPRVIVTPGAFHSKRFYILGKVVNKGAFPLDRPRTLLEAVAMASGLETGLFQLNTVELADFPRSFLVRAGRRVQVDFEKLFIEGDLSQNILMEPDDFLYFPSAIANEIYVLGSVRSPGAQGLTSQATVVSAVTLAGGFTEDAYQSRVLIVRGSLDHPQRIIVNTADALAARGKDFRLEPKDIIYVSDHPWTAEENLLEMAVNAFIQSMTAVWTGENIGPLITSPILPSIK